MDFYTGWFEIINLLKIWNWIVFINFIWPKILLSSLSFNLVVWISTKIVKINWKVCERSYKTSSHSYFLILTLARLWRCYQQISLRLYEFLKSARMAWARGRQMSWAQTAGIVSMYTVAKRVETRQLTQFFVETALFAIRKIRFKRINLSFPPLVSPVLCEGFIRDYLYRTFRSPTWHTE